MMQPTAAAVFADPVSPQPYGNYIKSMLLQLMCCYCNATAGGKNKPLCSTHCCITSEYLHPITWNTVMLNYSIFLGEQTGLHCSWQPNTSVTETAAIRLRQLQAKLAETRIVRQQLIKRLTPVLCGLFLACPPFDISAVHND